MPYIQSRPQGDGLKGSLLEFSVALDTALLRDTLTVDGTDHPAATTFHLLDILKQSPGLTLTSMNHGDVASFQNELMSLAGYHVTDVREICETLLHRLPDIFDEIKEMSCIPDSCFKITISA